MGRPNSPAVKGKELLANWQASITPKEPFGSVEKLNRLVSFKTKKRLTWNKIGCQDYRDIIISAIGHHEIFATA